MKKIKSALKIFLKIFILIDVFTDTLFFTFIVLLIICDSQRPATHRHTKYYVYDNNNLFQSSSSYYYDRDTNYAKAYREGTFAHYIDSFNFTSKDKHKYDFRFIEYEGYLYYFVWEYEVAYPGGDYGTTKQIYYNYKKIGVDEGYLENIQTINGELNYVSMNNLKFLICCDGPYYHNKKNVLLVEYNYPQISTYSYASLENLDDVYSFSFNNSEIILTNFNQTKKYNYSINKEMLNIKLNYTYLTIGDYIWFGKFSRYYQTTKNSIKYMDNGSLYFAYERILERGCNDKGCPIQFCKSELVKFNPITGEFKSLGLLPDNFRVLSIYTDHAVVISDDVIANYYFNEKELKNTTKIDVLSHLNENYKYQCIEFYIENGNFSYYNIYTDPSHAKN